MTTGIDNALPPGSVSMTRHEDTTDEDVFTPRPTTSSDPNEPLNWSNWRKILNFGLTLGVATAAFTHYSLQPVFWQQMTGDLGVTINQLNNAASGMLSGVALGCILFIPLTSKYGRRPTYLLSTAVMASVTWWMSKMTTNVELLLTSIFLGFSGAINETAVEMTITELFFVHQRGSANGVYFLAVMLGTFLTPVAGGAQADSQGWRSVYTTLAISLTILFVSFVLFFEETKYIPVVEGQPSDAAAVSTGSEDAQVDAEARGDGKGIGFATTRVESRPGSPIPLLSWRQRLRIITPTNESLWRLFVMPIHVIMLPHVFFTSLQLAACVSWVILFSSVISIVMSEPPYSFGTTGIGLMNLGPFVGNLMGSLYGGPLSDWSIVKLAKRNSGIYHPEMRLHLLALPTIMMAGGLIITGTTLERGMHWIYPSLGGAFFAFGLGATGNITFTMVIDTYRELTAEAFVGVAFVRNTVSIAAPFTVVPWMNSMSLTNMHILMGLLALVVGMLYIPLLIWGRRVRTALAPRYWRLVNERLAV